MRIPAAPCLYGIVARGRCSRRGCRIHSRGCEFRVGRTRFESPLTGRHNVSNLLAGIAVAGVYGIPPDRLTERIRNLAPGKMRGESFHHAGILVYNDCYNSNPEAVRAMLDVLRDTPARKRIAVLGEMLELGHWAEPLHRDVGTYAAESGLNVLVGIRGAACHMLDAAKRSGFRADAAFFFEDPVEAGPPGALAGRTRRRHPVQRLPRRARRTRSGAVSGGSGFNLIDQKAGR